MKKLILTWMLVLATSAVWAANLSTIQPDTKPATKITIVDTNSNTTETEVEGAIDEIYGLIGGLGGGHDAVTLSALLDSNLFSLSTQELGLDSQAANLVFAGPASGVAAAPGFRALIADDIPALPYEPAFDFGTGAGEINTDDIPEGSTHFYDDDGTDATGMENPMTAAGDMIVGGTAGAPTALAKGANNTLLGIDGSGTLGWQSSFSLDDSAAQFFNLASPTKLAKISCSGITAGQTRVMTWPDFNFTPAVLGSNLVPASSYYNFGTVAGSDGYGLRDNAGDMEYKNSDGDWAGIGSGGGGTSAGSQYDIQIADAASGFAAVTGEFKYQDHTLSIGTGGLSQAKTSGTAGFFTLYSNNSMDTTGAGLKGPTATLAASYYLIFPSAEPAATAIWAHAAASSHSSAGSWLYPGTSANNIVQLDGDAKYPAADGSNITNISATPNDTETIYDSDGGAISVTKNNTIVIAGNACSVTPKTPAAGVNLMIQNAPGTTGAITIVNKSGVYYGKADASGYNTVNYKYVSGGATTDRIVLIGIDSTHYIVATATGTWTDTAP